MGKDGGEEIRRLSQATIDAMGHHDLVPVETAESEAEHLASTAAKGDTITEDDLNRLPGRVRWMARILTAGGFKN